MNWQLIEPIITARDHHSMEAWRHLFDKWDGHAWHDHDEPSEKTNVLLVDASFVMTEGKPDMNSLQTFLKERVRATLSDLQLVSLFPYIGRQTDTAVDPRIRLYEDLGHLVGDFELMYELDTAGDRFDLMRLTDLLIERLAFGATKVRVHEQLFRGMSDEHVKDVLTLFYTVLHHYRPNGQLILANDGVDGVTPALGDAVDAVSHFDLASHVILAFAQESAVRLSAWARKIKTPMEGKTYFNFLSCAERDPFESDLGEIDPEAILAAHSILLSLQGIPSVDYRTLFGVTGPTDHDTLIQSLKTDAKRLNIFSGILGQLNVKRTQPALSPYATQRILDVDERLFAVERTRGTDTLLLYTNVSGDAVDIDVSGTNVFTGEPVHHVTLGPYGRVWVKPD